MPIRLLAPEVAAQIAAGEVIERPASVVKELVENALDAGARSIAVAVLQGGLELIRVADDGEGIPAQEMELAFARFATSKLSSPQELQGIRSLGFRGEALPSIAAVAQVTMISRPPGTPAAAALRLEEGQVVAQGQRGAPPGTTVEVRQLFAHQPARRRFLRSPRAEAQQIADLLSRYALAYPQVRFSLSLDGRQALQTDGRGSRRDVAAVLYGAPVAAALLEGQAQEGPMALAGLLSPPSLSRATRQQISLFINGRWVRSRPLVYALEQAYADLLPRGRYPLAVIDITLPPEEVDVNVHPAKAEVRLRREGEVFALLQRWARRTLLAQAPLAPLAAPSPVAAPLPAEPPPAAQPPLGEPTAPAPPPALALPILRVVGQMGETYVVAEGPDGLYLLDQHAAHERILYERLRGQPQPEGPEAQGLLEPLLVELSPRQEETLADYGEALAAQGFQWEPFGPRAYLLRAVPKLLAGREPRQALMDLLDGLGDEEAPRSPSAGSPDAAEERLAMTIACHGAIRAGQALSLEEMRQLLRQLEAAQNPHTCPHGRPTLLHMSRERLDREFRRR